ncbi:MAG: alpha-L-fucosidase [Pseudomonadota bacterium]
MYRYPFLRPIDRFVFNRTRGFPQAGAYPGKRLLVVVASCLLWACLPAAHADGQLAGEAGKPEQDEVEWFRDAKFGMFIHWGLYSHTGGVWNGERYYGITEWLMRRGQIPAESYKTIAADFNPVDYDAREWVELAKAAGVQYIVITSKHHDGFAMFHSEASDFNIVDATPYGRDPLKDLVEAARAAGIGIGFYYSQYQDWTEPHAGGNNWDYDEDGKDFAAYLESKAKPQLEELLTNYGPIDIIWFDTPGDLSREDAAALKQWVKDRQPGCLVSNRIGHDLGDYKGYADGEIPATPEPGRPWEAIFTHNDSWGYSDFDMNFKSTSEVLHLLIEIAGKGGNLMLNIGPDGRGRIPDASAATFRQVGDWLKANGEAIYGTSGSPIGMLPWGTITQRPGKLYLHVLRRPGDGRLELPGFVGELRNAYLLVNSESVEATANDGYLVLKLPSALPDPRVNVVVVEYEGDRAIAPVSASLVATKYGLTTLSVDDIDGGDTTVTKFSTMHYFGDWKHDFTVSGLQGPDNAVFWDLDVREPGTYKIVLDYSASAAQAGQEGGLSVNGREFYFRVLETGEFSAGGEKFAARKPLMFIDHPVAIVNFDKPRRYRLAIRPLTDGIDLMKLRSIEVRPHD